MPRIQTTRSVKIALLVLRIYLLGMLALILLKFFVFKSPVDNGGPQARPAGIAATAPATQKAPAESPELAPRATSSPGK